MKYPCKVIRDLLPLYIDKVCSEESRAAVDRHLSECEACRQYRDAMSATDGLPETPERSEDTELAGHLKSIKFRINRRIRNIVLCAAAVVLVFALSFQFLFHAPLKNIDPKDVHISARVYSLSELAAAAPDAADDASTVILYSDEKDDSEVVTVTIPDLGQISLTEDTIQEVGYVSVISTSSPYFLRSIRQEIKGNTLYISGFRTTLLNNRAEEYQKTMLSLEFRELDRIVFADGKTEMILWQR